MAYVNNTDISDLIPELLGVEKPTNTDVDAWCNQFGAVTDSRLKARGYSVPLTDASDILAVTPYIVERVAVNAVRAMEQGSISDERVTQWLANWETFLADIAEGNFILPVQSPAIYQTTVFHKTFSQID